MGKRTSACTPLMKARPLVWVYLSSRLTDGIGLWACGGKGAFMGNSGFSSGIS
jgi:hypothetical protein